MPEYRVTITHWLDDETKELAKLSGISEEKLSKLTSRDEFDRYSDIFEGKLIADVKKLLDANKPTAQTHSP